MTNGNGKQPAGAVVAEVREIALDQIVAGNNDRVVFAAGEIEELALSIKQHGLVQPILVRPQGDKYQIVQGERRYRAHIWLREHQQLERPVIRAIVREMDDRTASDLMLEENLKRVSLNYIEEAQAYQKRIDQFGATVEELAKRFSKNETLIKRRLGLLTLIDPIQKLVASDNMSIGYANELIGLQAALQQKAMEYFNGKERPGVHEFAMFCNRLKMQQDQMGLFDMEEFMARPVTAVIAEWGIAEGDFETMAQVRAESRALHKRNSELEGQNDHLFAELAEMTKLLEEVTALIRPGTAH